MKENTGTLAGTLIVGIGIGVLLCTAWRRRRKRQLARSQFQIEVQALRRDLEALRPEIDRIRQWRPGSS